MTEYVNRSSKPSNAQMAMLTQSNGFLSTTEQLKHEVYVRQGSFLHQRSYQRPLCITHGSLSSLPSPPQHSHNSLLPQYHVLSCNFFPRGLWLSPCTCPLKSNHTTKLCLRQLVGTSVRFLKLLSVLRLFCRPKHLPKCRFSCTL